MDYYIIILRLLHIVGGVFWAGSAFYLATFVAPAANSMGPEGGKFMQKLGATNKMPVVLTLLGALTILTGILMVVDYTDGFTNDWMGSPTGIVISIGGTLAIIAFCIGMFYNKPKMMHMMQLGQKMAESPSPEIGQQMNMLREQIGKGVKAIAWLVTFTVIAMSIAEWLVF